MENLRERHTFLRKCVMEGSPDAHTIWLKVGGQEFMVGQFAQETKDEAEKFRSMLATALGTMVATELSRIWAVLGEAIAFEADRNVG